MAARACMLPAVTPSSLPTSRTVLRQRCSVEMSNDTSWIQSSGNEKLDAFCSHYTKLLTVDSETVDISNTVLGRGKFGVVFKAVAHDLPTVAIGPTVVAAKTLTGISDRSQQTLFAEEVRTMLKCGHHVNIVNILGVVDEVFYGSAYTVSIHEASPAIRSSKAIGAESLILLEYCAHGSLHSYLQQRRNGELYSRVNEFGELSPFNKTDMEQQWNTYCSTRDFYPPMEELMLSTDDLIKFSYQICRGMEYLSARTIIHRDLAARNVLVSDNRIMKISDFGLARHGSDIYVVSNIFIALPILWMPPDAITTRTFSQKSDVWSFGVTLWEVFSLAATPFDRPNVAKFSANAFAEWLLQGNQMARPDNAPSSMYELMQSCWQLNQQMRPDFSELLLKLDGLLSDAIVQECPYMTLSEPDFVDSRFRELDDQILECLKDADFTECTGSL
ncbi:putative Vascular endothelial growth factor receptor 2 [Hypsibius exemplaris]|uniref:Vascular endothelial growth factor receptor 2 n=1 Tax=Hypsibius exemplaris TaxID=2072580 RepID=A0A9X6NBB1_HYPEX|nr:putative Vascular endothelial growth factor receptor 2 [Hypsibius exemplaris]